MNPSKPPPSANSHQPDLSGRQLGDYQILRRLGRGGMADVYLAEQSSLRRRVALKVLRQTLAAEESYVRRFHNEAHAAAALVHANIVQIYEVGCVDGNHFIAQEYVEGTNLKQLVSRHGALDTPRAMLVMRQVAAALHKAGRHGIIHRDIKPENILIGPGGETKVADFGLARITGDPSKMDLTQVGMTMGTPLYMSPEQVEGRTVDSRSDIYSLGVTCYHMLAGRPPFEGETALNVAVQHLKTQPERLENLCPDLPNDLSRIIHKMLAKGPDDRYASAVELLRDLRQVQVEGLDANWSGDLLDLDMSEQLVFSESPIGATRRLEAIMKESVETSAGRGSRCRWAAAILAAFLTGSMLAWSTRSDDLLGELPEVPKKESVEAQFWYATMMPSREAWESVWAYFPANEDLDPKVRALNKQYKRRAQQQLARFYLAKKDYDPALQIFRELGRAGVESSWKELEAFGLAGQAVVYYRQGKLEEYTDKWPDAQALSEYLDEDMKAELERIGPQSQEPTGTPAEPTTRS